MKKFSYLKLSSLIQEIKDHEEIIKNLMVEGLKPAIKDLMEHAAIVMPNLSAIKIHMDYEPYEDYLQFNIYFKVKEVDESVNLNPDLEEDSEWAYSASDYLLEKEFNADEIDPHDYKDYYSSSIDSKYLKLPPSDLEELTSMLHDLSHAFEATFGVGTVTIDFDNNAIFTYRS